jgi:hypothetical protein
VPNHGRSLVRGQSFPSFSLTEKEKYPGDGREFEQKVPWFFLF